MQCIIAKVQEDSRDSINHVQPHLDGAARVVGARLGQPGHAVVAVAEDLDAKAVVVLVKKQKQL